MSRYRVWVRLETEYDDVEADNEEEAFIIASEDAMAGTCWQYNVELLEEDEAEEEYGKE